MDKSSLGRNILKYRLRRGYTQLELANILNVTSQTISNWERGITEPSYEFLDRLCAILECSGNELLSDLPCEGESCEIPLESKAKPSKPKRKKTKKGTIYANSLTKLIIYKILVVLMPILYLALYYWASTNEYISSLYDRPDWIIFDTIFCMTLLVLYAFYYVFFICTKVKPLWIKIICVLLSIAIHAIFPLGLGFNFLEKLLWCFSMLIVPIILILTNVNENKFSLRIISLILICIVVIVSLIIFKTIDYYPVFGTMCFSYPIVFMIWYLFDGCVKQTPKSISQ